MIVKTRTTISGTEYWDAKNKKVLFVPKGKEPRFEVTKNPKSMINKQEGLNPSVGIVDETNINLEDMNAEQLLSFAKQINIEVPGNIKKEDTIRKHIGEVLAANDDK
ncbi:hypothetical protein P4571_06645 [Niallia alba]|uniref:hypothetical protein n=1 Tax=Niallia alba TaxID=2729105 RepID=UPI002E1B9D16|nr:hypothetical protein [Niallia alba]